MGDLTKDEVRERARALGLPVAEKAESQEICFIEGRSYRDFVKERAGDLGPPGELTTAGGAVVGRHDGVGGFTVGQRRGIGVAAEDPLYVIAIEPDAGRVVVGPDRALFSSRCSLAGMNWIPADRSGETFECEVKIRYRHPGARARVRALAGGRAELEFEEPQRAIAPGQAAVLYDGELVLGGGWIEK